MEDFPEIPHNADEEAVLNADIKFDPSDYLPRRTNRATAHAASKALKKSAREENAEPGKVTVKTEAVQDSDSDQDPAKETSRFGKAASPRKGIRKGKAPYDCRIKLVRCEEDPGAKDWMVRSRKKKDSSTYKVVYAPVTVNHQSNGNVVPVTKSNSGLRLHKKYMGPVSKYLSGERQPQQANKPSSLNVVVVHPKPGTKIINASQTRKTKSSRLNEMLSDPNLVISSEVSRIMTTGGNAELQCDKCSKTYRVARDLINHKKVAHKASQHMCTLCTLEFPTAEEVDRHKCKAKWRCDICGIFCRSAGMVMTHKAQAHPKTLGSFMCGVCCFNASSQEQLDAHVCGGKPKIKYSARASPAVMVFPAFDAGVGKNKPSNSSTASSNIYMNIPLSGVPGSSSSVSVADAGSSMQFLCEVCLNMFPDSAALASHNCDSVVTVEDDNNPTPATTNSTTISTASQSAIAAPPSGVSSAPPLPQPNVAAPRAAAAALPFEVMPEVEELAKFYSSVVFME